MTERDERVPQPGQPGHSGSFDDDLGGAIAAALAPLAPEPEAFAAGVRERVERGEASGDVKAAGPLRFSSWLRSAAAFLPPFLLPRELAEAGLVAGGLALKKSVWKLLPGVIAFPAIALVTVVASFFFAARRSGAPGTQTTQAKEAHYEVMGWWRRHWLAAFMSFGVLVYLALRAPTEAVILFVALSMFALIGLYGALGRAGVATREEVGRRVGQFQLTTLGWGFSFSLGGSVPVHAPSWIQAVAPTLLILGGVTCFALAFRGRGDRLMRAGLTLAMLPLFLILLGAVVLLAQNAKRRAHRADAVQYVEREFEAISDTPLFGRLSGAAHHLRADGGAEPDLTLLAGAVHARLDRSRTAKELPNPLGYWPLDEIGLIRAEDLARYRNGYQEEQLTKSSTPLRNCAHDYLPCMARLRFEGLDDAERDHIAARIVQGAREETGFGDLEELWCRVRFLEELERSDSIEQLAPAVRRTLLDSWTGGPGFEQGSFAPSPSLVNRDDGGDPVEGRLSFVWLDSTDWGLRLIGRFGAPPEIDLGQLAAYLDEQAVHHGSDSDERHVLAAAARSHLRVLRGDAAEQQGRLWRALLELRGTIAVGLLVALCVLVTLRAPKGAAAASAGS